VAVSDKIDYTDVNDVVDESMYESTSFTVRTHDASPRSGWTIYLIPFRNEVGRVRYAKAIYVARGQFPGAAALGDRGIPIYAFRMSDIVWVSKMAADVQVRMYEIAKDLHES
jgi:hypothetical protein